MKTKSMHKGLSVLLAVVMMLALIPLAPFTMKASAAGTTHVLNASELQNFNNKGDIPEGKTFDVDNGYFTIYCGKEARFDKNEKTFDDGFVGTQRINFNGGMNASTPANAIGFKTEGAATVKIWWAKGDADRQIAIADSSGKQVAVTDFDGAKNAWTISTLKVPAAGKYFLGGTPKTNYIFKIEVTEEAAAEAKEYTLDATKDLPNKNNKGDIAEGETFKVADFFTVYCGKDARFDSNAKDFEDGYHGDQRINFNGAVDGATPKNAIGFKTDGAAEVKVWWVANDAGREITIVDASNKTVAATALNAPKGAITISTLKVPAAGTYFLGAAPKANYIFKVVVKTGGAPAARADWSKVAAPVITSVKQEVGEDGKPTDNMVVSVNAVIGNDGGDALKVEALDKDGKVVAAKNSLKEGSSGDVIVPLTESGTYTFKATLSREGEADKTSASKDGAFSLTLKKPTIASVTNKGNGKVSVKWSNVDEAKGYVVYAGGKEYTSDTNSATIDGFKVGDKVEFAVAAVRGSELGLKSDALTVLITKEEQMEWGFTAYGTSATDDTKNKYEGNLNEGSVTVYAFGKAGKFNATADNGYSFYYTAVPADKNFTFRAKIHVDKWQYDNGQEGFGVAAVDMLPEKPYDSSHWTNFYATLVTRVGSARLGVVSQGNVGITPENWVGVKDSSYDRKKVYLPAESLDESVSGSKVNIVGNCVNTDALEKAGIETIANYTDFDLEITKNNTGFYSSYYKDGKLVKTVKHWGTDDLTKLDKDYIYVGIVAARGFVVSAKNSDVKLELRDPKNDPAPEPKPKTYITPSVSIRSGEYANSTNYNLIVKNGYKGTATVKVNGEVVKENVPVGDKLDSDNVVMETIIPVTIKPGKNTIDVSYKADTSVDLGENTEFKTTEASASISVLYDTYFAAQNNIYVAPNAKKGNGGKDSPIDLKTAMSLARPGQKIILKEGTYKFTSTVKAERNVSGTKDAMIYLMADPEAKTRPVLDFEGNSGIGLQILGDYWYLKGFDVCHAGSNGVRIDGNYCVADQIDARENYSTGLAIQGDGNSSRLLWPSYNLVKNCNAYYNIDPGQNNADGFSAKLIVGKGNVFDNCVSHHNSDDGWDFYGRNVNIEPVTIQNCVSYKNGYLKDGSKGKGGGNGFKLGGDNSATPHLLINSVAFDNLGAGITCNSSPNIITKNCVSYNNDGSGIAMYTKASNTNFESSGVISYKNKTADNFEPKGTQDVKKVDQTYWDGANGVADDWFKSLEFKGSVARNADGSINMEGFLELTDKAPKNAGAVIASVASDNVEITEDTDLPNPRTGFVPFAAVAVVIAIAALAVLTYKRKKA